MRLPMTKRGVAWALLTGALLIGAAQWAPLDWGAAASFSPENTVQDSSAIVGRWQLRMQTPAGEKTPVLTVTRTANGYAGELVQPGRDTAPISDVHLVGDRLEFKAHGRILFPIDFKFAVVLDGDRFAGSVKVGWLPATAVSANRISTKP